MLELKLPHSVERAPMMYVCLSVCVFHEKKPAREKMKVDNNLHKYRFPSTQRNNNIWIVSEE